jgi:glycosyltransferase involved in cell wall biosynthesis
MTDSSKSKPIIEYQDMVGHCKEMNTGNGHLNVSAPCNSFLGYGHAAFNIIKALYKMGMSISYFPIGQPQLTTGQEDAVIIKECVQNGANFSYDAPTLKIWHEFALHDRIGRGKLYTMSFFELDVLNNTKIHHLNHSDHILSPSTWAKDVMVTHQITPPITVCPMGVDSSIFKPLQLPNSDDTFRFLNVGKIEVRKGHDVLIEAFNEAFSLDDNVELCMMWTNPFLKPDQVKEWVNLYKGSKLGNKIQFIGQVKTDHELANIMNICDAGIFPTKAEGYCLPALQMLSCGQPIIITDYSAHTEFVTDKNSYLINITDKEMAYDGIWFKGEGEWGKIGNEQKDQMIEHMRHLYKNRPKNPEGIKTGKYYTWERTGKIILETINGV